MANDLAPRLLGDFGGGRFQRLLPPRADRDVDAFPGQRLA